VRLAHACLRSAGSVRLCTCSPQVCSVGPCRCHPRSVAALRVPFQPSEMCSWRIDPLGPVCYHLRSMARQLPGRSAWWGAPAKMPSNAHRRPCRSTVCPRSCARSIAARPMATVSCSNSVVVLGLCEQRLHHCLTNGDVFRFSRRRKWWRSLVACGG